MFDTLKDMLLSLMRKIEIELLVLMRAIWQENKGFLSVGKVNNFYSLASKAWSVYIHWVCHVQKIVKDRNKFPCHISKPIN
jgi:hypothetical protein